MQPIILYYQPYSSFRWLPHDFDDRSKWLHARVQRKPRVRIPKQVGSACSQFFGWTFWGGFEGKIRVESENGQTDVINRMDSGRYNAIKRPNFRRKINNANSARFRHGKFIAYAVFMLDNFAVSKSLSLFVNERFNRFHDIVRIVFPFPFLSFFFFIPFFFTPLSVLVFALLFGFSLVSFFFFLIPPRIKFLWKFIPPLPLIRCSTRRACNFREAHISSARILAAVSHASHRPVTGFCFFEEGNHEIPRDIFFFS